MRPYQRRYTERSSDEDIGGWQDDSCILGEKADIANITTNRNTVIFRKPVRNLRSKQNVHVLTEQSEIHNLKLRALKLDSDTLIPERMHKVWRKLDDRKRSQDLGSLLKVSNNNMIGVKSKQDSNQTSKLRRWSKTKTQPRCASQANRLRVKLLKDLDDTKKCLSTIGSIKNSRRSFLNYSEKIRNCSINKKTRTMRLTLWDPCQTGISFCNVSATSKLDLINNILKDKYPQIF